MIHNEPAEVSSGSTERTMAVQQSASVTRSLRVRRIRWAKRAVRIRTVPTTTVTDSRGVNA